MGRLDHQMNATNNYSVRFLWDHQPNYNQVLTGGGSEANLGGTLDTLSIEKGQRLGAGRELQQGDWRQEAEYPAPVGGHEKPKRGQPLYQETGDWTKALPTLQFLNFIDQTDDNYADYRNMNVYGLDDTFSWFIEGSGGSHDVKFGTQYQLGEHYREDQRVTNGRFIFPSDRPFNAADASTYPERLQVRVPQMVKLLSRTHSLGLYLQDKWQVRSI
jgi:hypothetical protein